MSLGFFLGIVIALITLPGTFELLLLTTGCVFACIGKKRKKITELRNINHSAVVIPAHNEEESIQRTIKSLKNCRQTSPPFDIVVVADNCTDHTEERARQENVRVLVRHDRQKTGKGYALDFAFQKLLSEGYGYFFVVDADTIVKTNFITELLSVFEQGADVVQARYEVLNPRASWRTKLLHIAFLVQHLLRPKGREWWGFSVGIFGNGFALSREVLLAVPYHVYSIVEDLEYHIRLVEKGYKVRFADQTAVQSEMPVKGRASLSQRTRWEGGRARMMIKAVPSLIRGIFFGNGSLVEPLLDLLLLPLAFHTFLLFICLAIPFSIIRSYALIALCIVGLHVFVACRLGYLKAKDMAVIITWPFYLLWKLSTLRQIFKTATKNSKWIRTERKE